MTGVKRPKKKLKRDSPEAAMEKIVESKDIPILEDKVARNVNMFKGWIAGKTYDQLAEENNLSHQSICLIASQYKWRAAKKELQLRQMALTVDRVSKLMSDMNFTVIDALFKDMKKTIRKAQDEKRELTTEDRAHFRALMEKTVKEVRLDQGKPTEITDGPPQVQIVLPPGAKRFGLIPPDPKLNVIETEKVEETKMDIDAIADDIKEDGEDS